MQCRSVLLSIASFVAITGLSAVRGEAYDISGIEQQFRAQHLHQTYILRGFYQGRTLHFNVTGQPLDEPGAGDWTVDGVVEVGEVKLSSDLLWIRVRRLHLTWVGDYQLKEAHDLDKEGKPDPDESKNRELVIEADLGSNPITADAVDAAFSRIFLGSGDSFAEVVPEYWKRCVLTAVRAAHTESVPSGVSKGCRFPSTFLSIPGVASIKEESAVQPISAQFFRVGAGVSPPRTTYSPEPEFSEPARKARFQGTATLSLIVSKEGLPTNIQVLSPIGCGLDEKAIHAIERWKFQPAMKDGQPVPVEIAVEVDFHLY